MAQDEYIRTALRVPPALHKAIHAAADEAGHSFNAEILGRLQGSFEGKGAGDLVLVLAHLERVIADLGVERNELAWKLGMLAAPLRDLLKGETVGAEQRAALLEETESAMQVAIDAASSTADKLTNQQIARYRVKALSERINVPPGETQFPDDGMGKRVIADAKRPRRSGHKDGV